MLFIWPMPFKEAPRRCVAVTDIPGSAELLLNDTSVLVKTERVTTTAILHHLQEIERRRLYAARGFSSLFAYVVNSLGYSEASAQRRISSMRLLKSLEPQAALEVEAKVQKGSLSLSVLAQAQTFFREEEALSQPLSQAAKKDVLGALEGKSTREASEELKNRSSLGVQPIREYSRAAGHGRTEIHLVVDQKTLKILEDIKGILSHANPQMGWGELVGHISQIAWQKLDPCREPARRKKEKVPLPETTAQASNVEVEALAVESVVQAPVSTSVVKTERIAIPAALKREVRKDTEGKCTYVDPLTGTACGSSWMLQFEHIYPVALGGKNERQNLTSLCFSHNQLAALREFGQATLAKYVPSLK